MFRLTDVFTRLFTLQLNFLPTHIAVSANMIALYQKLTQNQFKLHVVGFEDDICTQHQEFESDKRCKSLQIDNNEVCIVYKGRRDKYWF